MKTQGQHLSVNVNNDSCEFYLARPTEEGNYPGVLFLMDAFGIRPYLYQMADQLAAEGYIVFMPNIFFHTKKIPVTSAAFPLTIEAMPQARADIMGLARNFNLTQGLADIGIYLKYLSEQNGFNGKIGVTGYCMGGGLAIRAAGTFPDQIQAVACFHAGNLVTEAADSPHTFVSKIKAHVYAAHADNDANLPQEQIEKFQKALESSNLKFKAEIYSGAAHGFTMTDLPAGNAAATEKHWKNLLELFSSALKK